MTADMRVMLQDLADGTTNFEILEAEGIDTDDVIHALSRDGIDLDTQMLEEEGIDSSAVINEILRKDWDTIQVADATAFSVMAELEGRADDYAMTDGEKRKQDQDIPDGGFHIESDPNDQPANQITVSDIAVNTYDESSFEQ